ISAISATSLPDSVQITTDRARRSSPDVLRNRRQAPIAPEPPDEARVERAKLEDEIRRHKQGAERKGYIPGLPHPLPENRVFVERGATGVGVSVLKNRG